MPTRSSARAWRRSPFARWPATKSSAGAYLPFGQWPSTPKCGPWPPTSAAPRSLRLWRRPTYPGPSSRDRRWPGSIHRTGHGPCADLDVVVTRDRFLDAIASAQRLRFSYSDRAVPQWRWFDLVCREGVNLHDQAGGNVDFHHHVPPWALGSGLTVEGIIERSQPAELCGRMVRFADPQDLVVVSALHILNDLWKGKMGLTSWRDVMIITRRLGETGTRDAFARADIDWMFDMLAHELAAAFPAAGFANSPGANVPWGPKLRLATSGWANHSKASRHRLSWATRLPALNGIAFLAGTAVPSPGYVRTRHGGYLNYWRQGWRETVSTAHGSDFRMTTIDDYSGDQVSTRPSEQGER